MLYICTYTQQLECQDTGCQKCSPSLPQQVGHGKQLYQTPLLVVLFCTADGSQSRNKVLKREEKRVITEHHSKDSEVQEISNYIVMFSIQINQLYITYCIYSQIIWHKLIKPLSFFILCVLMCSRKSGGIPKKDTSFMLRTTSLSGVQNSGTSSNVFLSQTKNHISALV